MKNIFILLLLVVSTTSFAQSAARALTFRNQSTVDIEVLSIETNYYFLGAISMPYYLYGDGAITIPPGKEVMFMQTNNATSFPFCCTIGCEFVPSKIWQMYSAPSLECEQVPPYGGTEFVYFKVFKYMYKMGGEQYAYHFNPYTDPDPPTIPLPLWKPTGPTVYLDGGDPGPITISQTVTDIPLVYNQVITFR
ncbi:MAG: hypothetical protein LBI32_01865 [Myroides odoratus]|jgi:hypothetical protein|nr:hypothetical protein [Myroides odoratus]